MQWGEDLLVSHPKQASHSTEIATIQQILEPGITYGALEQENSVFFQIAETPQS